MEPAPESLWDFVSQTPFGPIRYIFLIPKFFGINYLHNNSIPLRRWHTVCSLLGNLKRLASRGGRNRTSTRCPVLGRQLGIRGLAPAPFFNLCGVFPRVCHRSGFVVVLLDVGEGLGPPFFLSPTSQQWRIVTGLIAPKKSERPLGGAAARAWGWRVL
jgi:hypothetical protein